MIAAGKEALSPQVAAAAARCGCGCTAWQQRRHVTKREDGKKSSHFDAVVGTKVTYVSVMTESSNFKVQTNLDPLLCELSMLCELMRCAAGNAA